jgi:lipoyl(octanoyl) transferase
MIQFLYLGRIDYDEGLRLQAEVAGLVREGRAPNTLLLLEHPPVLTLGRNARRENILASAERLESRGVQVHEIDRGGDVTYHGPGQLVGYPIFDLRSLRGPKGGRMGPVDFVRQMEEALIRLCAGHGLTAGRIQGLTGVWLPGPGDAFDQSAKKVAAIGIHVSRGVVTHGFALNVATDLSDFELIVPCGIRDHAVTSMRRELPPGALLPDLDVLAREAAARFGEVLGEPVEELPDLAMLRARAQAFPAEDRPVEVPDEVQRIGCRMEPPQRA